MLPVSESLQKAREAVATLQSELPDFEKLLADNEKAADTLRRERADLTRQAEAKGRVNVAREMLEQHHADVHGAQAEVSRLEAEAGRAATLAKLADHAKTAQELRARYDREMQAAVTQLEKRLDSLRGVKAGLAKARSGFFAEGFKLAPEGFGRRNGTDRTTTPERAARQAEQAAAVLGELGDIDLTYVLTTFNPHVEYQLDDPRSPHNFRVEGELAVFIANKTGL